MALTRWGVIVTAVATLSGCTATLNNSASQEKVFSLAEQADQAYQSGNCLASINLYTELVKDIADEAMFHLRLGNCYARAGDLAMAGASFENAVQIRANYPQAWTNLVRIRQREMIVLIERMLLSLEGEDTLSQEAMTEAGALLDRLTQPDK